MSRAGLALVGVAATAAVAGATTTLSATPNSTSPPWTVAQMSAAALHPVKIVNGTYSKAGTHFVLVSTYGYAHNPGGAWDLSGTTAKYRGGQIFDTKAATCRGVGVSRAGRYAGFACDLTIGISSWPDIRTATYWIRPWTATTICVSDRALAACPPATPAKVLAGDPRDCKNVPGNELGDAAFCTIRAAEYAGYNALHVATGKSVVLFGCLAASVWVYRCTEGGFPSTPLRVVMVTFAVHKGRWTTSTALQP